MRASVVRCAVVVSFGCAPTAAGSQHGSDAALQGHDASTSSCGVERCGDGLDEDCDHMIDEDCPCADGERSSCYPGNAAQAGLGDCTWGSMNCSGGRFGPCTGAGVPSAPACDGIDHACTGQIDIACACRLGRTQSCYVGPSGSAGVGPCRRGESVCVSSGASAAWSDCAGQVLPTTEVCGNGIDDDCNGHVDDGSCGVCGDGNCSLGETHASCAAECPSACGNHACDAGENCGTCPTDCRPCSEACAVPTTCGPCAATPGCGWCGSAAACEPCVGGACDPSRPCSSGWVRNSPDCP